MLYLSVVGLLQPLQLLVTTAAACRHREARESYPAHDQAQHLTATSYTRELTLALAEADALVYGGEKMGRFASCGRFTTTNLRETSATQYLSPDKSNEKPKGLSSNASGCCSEDYKIAALQHKRRHPCLTQSREGMLCEREMETAKRTQKTCTGHENAILLASAS